MSEKKESNENEQSGGHTESNSQNSTTDPAELGEKIIKDAIVNCIDPVTNCDLVSLGMIDSVDVQMGEAQVAILLPCSIDAYSNTKELEQLISSSLADTGMVSQVKFKYASMTESEKDDYILHLETTYKGKSQLKDSTRVIAISSGKGGVGKSSVTTNLAISISKLGYRVGLLDADVYGFSIPNMLGPEAEPIVIGNSVVPARAHKINFVSAGLFADDDQPIIWRGPMLHKALEQFLANVMWCEPDFLVLDMPPGTGDVALSIASLIPDAEFYVVTTPQKSAESVAQRSAIAARQLKLPLRGVIENMSYFEGDNNKRYELFGRGGGQQLADHLSVKLLGQIPLVPDLRAGSDNGIPIVISDPNSNASKEFEKIADEIVKLGPAKKRLQALKVR